MKVRIRKDAHTNKNNNKSRYVIPNNEINSSNFEIGKILTLSHKNDAFDTRWYVEETDNWYNEAWLEYYEEIVIDHRTDKGDNKIENLTYGAVKNKRLDLYAKSFTETVTKFDKKENKVEIEKYNFKGDISFDIIVDEAIKDNKRSFVVMGKENAVVGILKNTELDLMDIADDVVFENGKFIQNYNREYPYFLMIIEIKDVNEWIKVLREEKKTFLKSIRKMKDKIKKKIKKGTNSKDRFKVFVI